MRRLPPYSMTQKQPTRWSSRPPSFSPLRSGWSRWCNRRECPQEATREHWHSLCRRRWIGGRPWSGRRTAWTSPSWPPWTAPGGTRPPPLRLTDCPFSSSWPTWRRSSLWPQKFHWASPFWSLEQAIDSKCLQFWRDTPFLRGATETKKNLQYLPGREAENSQKECYCRFREKCGTCSSLVFLVSWRGEKVFLLFRGPTLGIEILCLDVYFWYAYRGQDSFCRSYCKGTRSASPGTPRERGIRNS